MVKLYLVSLVVGILAGLLYGVLNVRSPAPPVVALVGLLGMLIGEQMIPFGKKMLHKSSEPVAYTSSNSSTNTPQTDTKNTKP